MMRRSRLAILVAMLLLTLVRVRASGHSGRVAFNGVPVPGAKVTAIRGDTSASTVSDSDGRYQFPELADGEWTFHVEMTGFETARAAVVVGSDRPEQEWLLVLRSYESLSGMVSKAMFPPTTADSARAGAPALSIAPPESGSNPRPPANRTPARPALPPSEPVDPQAADSFLVNGSVNNGAASPFAQMAAFGNNRRGGRSLYNGGVRVQLGNSAWDSRPYTFGGRGPAKPSYDDLQVLGNFGGPLRIPGLRNGPNLFLGYQRGIIHNTAAQSALVPTRLERGGDFSQSVDALGRDIVPIDPQTGQPFPNRTIPEQRISPQAASLLNYYPVANVAGATGYNYEAATLTATQADSLQLRATQTVGRNSLSGALLYSRTATDARDLFGFTDSATASTTDATVNWSRRISQFTSLRLRYQYIGQFNAYDPFFAYRTNVSGDAGISGNDQSPENWGPPTLSFTSGLAGLSSGNFADNHGATHTASTEIYRSLGRHGVTFGGGYGRQGLDIFAQQDGRGRFGFTGGTTRSDLADFLLGLPATSAIVVGNADKQLHGATANLYVNDDWRISPSLTVNAGVRWEYESPLVEETGRLANIDVAPDFSSVATIVSGQATGSVSGAAYTPALLGRDLRGVQPRIGAAWRPVAGSSLVVRGGYGVYRNQGVYQSLSLLLAQQPPTSPSATWFSKAFSVATTPDAPLTLANGFNVDVSARPNTFGIDPAFRIGYAHNWQLSAQRDLPGSLTVIGTYLGTSGRHLMQQFLPNTYPRGAANPCLTCPNGFVYLTSNGTSLRNSGQVQVRRRLRNGFMASAQYTLAKATDNASGFVPLGNPLAAGSSVNGASSGTTGVTGATIAQNWLDLDAEHGRSSFDQRHQLTVEVQYTTGMGLTSGALDNSLRGRLFNGWTMTAQLTTGSGLPLTPVVLVPVSETGFTGTTRATLTGASIEAPSGYYLNPEAYSPGLTGQWGTAGRNSISGPAQFVLNASLGRSFLWGNRASLDWRLDASNVLNTVTYAGVNTSVGSPQFGLPNRANSMRKIQASISARF